MISLYKNIMDKEGENIRAKVYLQSNQNECGLCAIASLASLYGFVQPIEFYRKKFYVGRDGLSLNNLVSIFSNICLNATVEKISELCAKNLKKRSPCILYLDHHYVVLEKIKREICYIVDPAVGQRNVHIDDLKQQFGGYIVTIKKGVNFKKYKSKESDFRHISKLFHELAILLLIVTIVSVVSNILTIIIPILLQNIVDILVYENSDQNIIRSYLYLAVILALYVMIVEGRNRSLVFLQCKIMSKISCSITRHLLKVKYAFFDSKNSADVLFRLNLLKSVEQTVSMTVISLIMGLSTISVIFIYFLFYCSRVALMLAVVSIGMMLYVYISNKKMAKVNEKYVLSSKKFEGLQTEIVINIFQIKAMGIEKYFSHRVDRDFGTYKQAYKENQNVVMRFNMNINTLEIFLPIILIVLSIKAEFLKTQSFGQLIVIYVLVSFFVKHEAVTVVPKRTKEFCNLITSYQKDYNVSFSWGCESRADIVDEELLEAMKEAGCTMIQFGMESGNDEVLKSVKKRIIYDQIYNAVGRANKCGLKTNVSIMIGHHEDTCETIEETLAKAKSLQDEFGANILFAINTPYPGTELRENLNVYGAKLLIADNSKLRVDRPSIKIKNVEVNKIRQYYDIAERIFKMSK